jgi:asparagine synthase (glutamine-hydrolysing)
LFRYLAFVWNPANPAACERARALSGRLAEQGIGWTTALRVPGLEVHHAGAQPGSFETYRLRNDCGVVVGKLFRGGAHQPSVSAPAHLDAADTIAIVGSSARALIRHYWGRYVAFVRDAATATVFVLRDPTSTLPCFEIPCCGIAVYCSSAEDCVRLGVLPSAGSVNWPYIAQLLCLQAGRQTSETGLTGVSEVLGGECREWRDGRVSRTFLWDPIAIAHETPIEDLEEATAVVRATTLDVVHAWAAGHSAILHALSGGLDSSIVLACLQTAPSQPRITGINYYSEGSNSDEREYAYPVAERAGFELVTQLRDPTANLSALFQIDRTPSPHNYLSLLDSARCDARVAAQTGATVITNGFGGDQLFCRNGSCATSDFLARHPFGRSVFRIAWDEARLERASVWDTLGQALRNRFKRPVWDPRTDAGRFSTLVRREVVDAVRQREEAIHPLLMRARTRSRGEGIFKGKLDQIQQLMIPPPTHNPFGSLSDPELLAPLCSQPLLEACLRIPMYVHTAGGWDRVTARRAFESDLPRAIVTRVSKGGFEEHAKELFLRNLPFVRPRLLDGRLVREGLLDRAQLEAVLSNHPTRITASNVELYDAICIEGWLARWSEEPTPSALEGPIPASGVGPRVIGV